MAEAATATHLAGAERGRPRLEEVAAAFSELEVLEWIGEGGMGVVFKARQRRLDRIVALKILPEALSQNPAFAERFNREARFLAQLNHPNIVTVYDFGQAGKFFYLLMEYVDGVNLREAIRAGRFSPREALGIVPKICDALQYAHDRRVLHRDIKPENILLDTEGRVKIADFGIAKLLGVQPVTLTASGTAVGTPHYMAPEQMDHPSEIDHRADIYSLGVVFYEMLTGELPLGRFAPPSSKSQVDARVDEIVLRALEREKELRQQSATQMKTEVENVSAEQAPPPRGAAAAPSTPAVREENPWLRRIFWLLFATIIVPPVLILVGLAVAAYQSEQRSARVRPGLTSKFLNVNTRDNLLFVDLSLKATPPDWQPTVRYRGKEIDSERIAAAATEPGLLVIPPSLTRDVRSGVTLQHTPQELRGDWMHPRLVFLLPDAFTAQAAAEQVRQRPRISTAGSMQGPGSGSRSAQQILFEVDSPSLGRYTASLESAKPASEPPFSLVVDASGTVSLHGRPRSDEELSGLLKSYAASDSPLPAVIQAASETPQAVITRLLQLCDDAGLPVAPVSRQPPAATPGNNGRR